MTGLRDDVRLVSRGWRWTRRPLVPASAQPYAPAPERHEFPTAWARTRAGVAARHVIQRYGLAPLVRAEVQPVVSGLDVLDRLSPPVLFVANHSSHLDTALLLTALPEPWRRRTTVAAAADYFFDVWWRAVGSALAFNTFPIDRRSGALTTTPSQLLAEGWNMVVYPEGGRSPDGWLQRFRPGAAWLAVQHGVPVVPIGISGSYAAMPRGRGWPVPGRPPVHIRFGWPIQPESPRSDRSARALADRLRDAVARLLDEEDTTWWQSMRRRDTPAPVTAPPAAAWRRAWESSTPPARDRRPRAWDH